eukprot:CAMPEP_0202491366 /NCGR_PEP_ID=MMETSP1361-20130828/8443_1 /ASSEMBLY_ACC=CAM_ASM_000849 /TAXON_ID=210615 /ORGANISM="Staurosira complex sp., Strain CCMP2646" /LENGTH=611 /DNA_ID=CAMNT_0049121397 /DNA_START=280 /DNA_END=2115 /DNA_ORIENTATION=+
MTVSTSDTSPETLSTQEDGPTSDCPFRVLGIALVVDEIGKGARLGFRYPVTPSDSGDDLFFSLPPRLMAKLFRPKKPLCQQPMTISVGETVFCCRAIIMDDGNLDLFNVIVALAPTAPTTTIPIAGWLDDSHHADDSPSFLAVRRVHMSIARLCRVLAREERRCQYVSLQSSQLIKLQEIMRQELDQRSKVNSAANSVDATEVTQASKRRSHRRGLSGNAMASISAVATSAPTEKEHPAKQESLQFEVEQEILEQLLAISPPDEHHGNLAHELVQVYHALAWKDEEFLPTPSILLSGSHGIIHVNRHVAVCIEPAASGSPILTSTELPRSYQTLLFPHATPNELVQSLHMASAPPRLQQLLLMVNPRKSLAEITVDAALPLGVTLELAAFLVKQGACVVSSVVTRKTTLACLTTAAIQERALDFSQEFGVSIFIAVSVFSSSGLTLGEIMSGAATGNSKSRNDDAALLGREISQQFDGGVSPAEIEEVVYNMAVWLRSHQVVINMEEYLVAVGTDKDGYETQDSKDSWSAAVEASEYSYDQTPFQHPESLYKELLDNLTGSTSTAALCWRFELDPMQLHRLKSWGLVNNKLRVLSRVPSPNDDWNTKLSKQ